MNKELNTKAVQLNILKHIVLILFILLSMITSIVLYQQDKAFKKLHKITHESIHKSIQHILKHNTRHYRFLLQRLSQTTNIKQYIIDEDTEAIYNILRPKLESLQKENKYFKTLHIIKEDGTSLLRVHKKEYSGDNLVNTRPMVKNIVTNQKIISGFETGKHSTVFRVIIPIFDNGKYIASMEIGINPNYFIEKISEIINEKGALFIHNENLKLYSKKSDFSIQDFKLQTQLDNNELNILKQLPKGYNFEDNIQVKLPNKTYKIHTISATGFKGDIYAKYIFIQDITEPLKQQYYTRIYLVLTIIFFVIIVFLVIRFYLNKFSKQVDKFYIRTIHKINFNKEYLKAVEDNSSNIIVTSFGKQLFSANRRFFEFTGFNTVEDFSKKYDCICDLFIIKDNYLQKYIKGKYWIEYIVRNPDKIHKAIMLKNGEEHIFQVTSAKLHLDENNRCVATFVDITQLEKLQSRYEIAINGSNDGLWDLDILTNKPYFSPRWKSMLGYKEDEIENSFQAWEDLLHPDDVQKTLLDIESSLKSSDVPYENIHRLLHKDGHWVWILTRGKVIFDEDGQAVRMVGFHTDITKTKELEFQLKENQDMYLDFFEHTKSANIIYKTEDDGKTFVIKDLNHLVEELEHVKKKDIINKRVDEVFSGVEEFGLLDIFKEVYETGKPYKMPTTLYEDNKLIGWKENYIFKLSNGDIVASYEDRTKEKELEAELGKQEELMIAQSRHAAMGEMISMIAHQWRQPLSIISMGANHIMADIELDTLENDSLQQQAKEIIDQTQELSKTIDDFKNFFRPIKSVENILPEDIFDETLKVVGKSLENNDIEVIKEFNNGKKIQTFSRELMQVFINIIKNAKEVLIQNDIEHKKIVLSIDEANDYININICDNGGGISKDVIDKIFNPYFSTKDEKTGTGLGLYMSKTIVEKHLNGTINVFNREDGACFIIRLPVKMKGIINE